MVKRYALCAALVASAFAQRPGTNYDESKVPKYTLPDPLRLADGQKVRDAATWNKRRRPEIFKTVETNMYGRMPARPKAILFDVVSVDKQALGGKAVRKQVTVYLGAKKDGSRMNLLLYLPAGAAKKAPVFLGLNFTGNHTVNADPGIRLGDVWVKNQKQPATEKTRGTSATRWHIEKAIARGYGTATAYYFDIEPDFDGGAGQGVRSAYFKPGQTESAPDEWRAIGAWAWGLSRALDYLEKDKDVDARRVVVHGHSRLGKAALWAGASDPRFAMVISNCSGEGGAALSRRKFGETVTNLNTRFPHWFCANYAKFNDREDDMPWDQHEVLALIAPRPLYVASATEDQWADPRGEFLAAFAAGPVYELFGKPGIGSAQMPAAEQPTGDNVRYHLRTGKHDITEYDWNEYLNFADRRLPRK